MSGASRARCWSRIAQGLLVLGGLACAVPPADVSVVDLDVEPLAGQSEPHSGDPQGPGASRPESAASVAPAELAAARSPSEPIALVARVGGEGVPIDELLSRWWMWDHAGAREFLERTLATRLAHLEAGRLGIEVDPDRLADHCAALRAEVEAAIGDRLGPMGVEEYLRLERGVDPGAYFARLAREATDELVAERAVRTWLLGREHVVARVLVTEDEGSMKEVLSGLGAGRDFVELVGEYSVDPTRAVGGLIPPIIRSEVSPLSRLAFSTPVGGVGGPLHLDGRSFCIRVEARPRPLEGGWSAVSEAVEASLRERPVDEAEFLQWRVEMEAVYEIDRSPFFELVGEPRD